MPKVSMAFWPIFLKIKKKIIQKLFQKAQKSNHYNKKKRDCKLFIPPEVCDAPESTCH